MKQFKNFIGGEYVATGKTFEKRTPVDNSLIGQVHEAGQAEVDAAVRAAQAALKGEWGRMSVNKRVELLYAVADEINRRFDDFLAAEVADTGKPQSLASHIDIPRGAANFKVFADIVKNVPTESFEMTTPDGGTALSYALRSPVGVVAVVCPWNLPLLLMTWKVGPALACGNTVVVKPSEETPATATLLGEVMKAVGIPDGVYNVVHGFGPELGGRVPDPAPGRRRDHLHRRDAHRRGHHGRRRQGRAAGQLRARRQERRHRVRRRRLRQGGGRHHAQRLRELRPGLPGHRARLRAAADLRQVRRRAEGAKAAKR
jgi:hypothetical protein